MDCGQIDRAASGRTGPFRSMMVLPAGGTLGTHDLLAKLWTVVLASLDVPEGASVKALTPAGMFDFLAERCNNLSWSIAGRFRVRRGLSIASLHRLMCNPLFGLLQTEPPLAAPLPLAAGQSWNPKTRAASSSLHELTLSGNRAVVLQHMVMPRSEPSSSSHQVAWRCDDTCCTAVP